MNPMLGRALLLLCSAAAIGCGVLALTSPLAMVSLPAASRSPAHRPVSSNAAGLDSLVRAVWSRTPFRAQRRPATVAFDPRREIQSADLKPATTKPVLVLSGIVWGKDPTVVIQGLPGVEGSKVVRTGDQVGGIRVRRIERERVWVAGLDTTWSLAVREPWK